LHGTKALVDPIPLDTNRHNSTRFIEPDPIKMNGFDMAYRYPHDTMLFTYLEALCGQQLPYRREYTSLGTISFRFCAAVQLAQERLAMKNRTFVLR